jgi:plastocyanin domain-containing protein
MKYTILAIIGAAVLIGGVLMLGDSSTTEVSADNVRVENGVQIVEIRAKGGYFPRKSTATAGIPTIIRFDGEGSFDCSTAVRIPSMNLSTYLSRSEPTDLDIGTQKVGILRGSCGMGMYRFDIEFKS